MLSSVADMEGRRNKTKRNGMEWNGPAIVCDYESSRCIARAVSTPMHVWPVVYMYVRWPENNIAYRQLNERAETNRERERERENRVECNGMQ